MTSEADIYTELARHAAAVVDAVNDGRHVSLTLVMTVTYAYEPHSISTDGNSAA